MSPTADPSFFLGLIPARGGSKGIARKNLREVGGIPLVVHAIRSANGSRRLDACLVSTDDQEIADVARSQGGCVPFMRPADLASDNAPTWSVMRHAVQWYQSEHGTTVTAVVLLQPTEPLRQAEDIDKAIDIFVAGQPEADGLISVCEAANRHPLSLYFADGPYLKSMMPGLDPNTRRQDVPTVYWRNGAIYIARHDLIFEKNRSTSERPLFYVMPADRAANIDEPLDLEIAELLYRRILDRSV